MTNEQIYDLFKLELDDEEFDSDETFILALNVCRNELFGERDWLFLRKSVQLTLINGEASLAPVTDLFKPVKIYSTQDVSGDQTELKLTDFANRFDTAKDFYYDEVNNKLVDINNAFSQYGIILEYTYTPDEWTSADMEEEDTVLKKFYHSFYSYDLVLRYLESDQTTDFYSVISAKRDTAYNKIVDYNESLVDNDRYDYSELENIS